jgi:alkylation response protein AidB-like acyl-CoA dehydrogenase
MDFDYSPRTRDLIERVRDFMDTHIYPAESVYAEQHAAFGKDRYRVPPILEELKDRARAAGLWNLFLPHSPHGYGLTNLEYAPLAEIMGEIYWASEVFNCSAPDTGNMEVLDRYGDDAQKAQWLAPLLAGEIRSAFLMTEPAVASSDARNIQTRIERDGDHYVINGRKWWSSGAGDPRCRLFILMGKTDPGAASYRQQSMILVEPDTPGLTIRRFLNVYGFDDAPHGHAEITLENVRVPVSNMLKGEGAGFEIAQGRLGPGRIHHCMRTIGVAERALRLLTDRLCTREAFGSRIIDQSVWHERIAAARMNIEMCRLLTLKAADMMDKVGNKVARAEIAMIKVAAPKLALEVIDWAIQGFGGAGVSQDTPLSQMFAHTRILRIADGPDEVHNRTIARMEIDKAMLRLDQARKGA